MAKYNYVTDKSCFPYIASDDVHDPLSNICVNSSITDRHDKNNNDTATASSSMSRVGCSSSSTAAPAAIKVMIDDCSSNHDTIQHHNGYVRAKNLVHPFLMQHAVANDVQLGNERDVIDNVHGPVLLLTGPNMAGKSTFMRTVAVNVILAQLGAPVCATQMELKVFDRIFTRIGARDAG
uniref:DNA mismatch repair protein MutS n=1 Tax=Lygus hesperus TaxID=30085 RepID=A0A0A9X945_LYGHE